jgi:cell division protein FtsZ
MKGARGLLISITGGKDLTLFEVDEAATRIREEVDQDANIIVGATFDETLDGTIRVSVVATGIDQTATARLTGNAPTGAATPPDSRLAELTNRLKADNQRMAERLHKQQDAGRPAAAAAPVQKQVARPAMENIDRAALAAIAAAVSPEHSEVPAPEPMQPAAYGDVTIRPIPPKPSMFQEQAPVSVQLQEPTLPTAFIPPAAERAPLRAPRMPKFDELPMPAQNQIRQATGEVEDDHPQKTRLSLLQRLANVGLGRRDEESEPPIAARASGPAMPQMPPQPERKPQRPASHTTGAGEPVSEYARRPAPQGLDSHGRPASLPSAQGDDHLDIPAFLRRQSS